MILYGIKNCNTVKKAISWLNDHHISFEFHDYKKSGISQSKLQEWKSQVNFDFLINKKGTTWRNLDETKKEQLLNEKSASEVVIENPSMIKRPIIEQEGKIITIGFDEKEFSEKYKS